MKPFVTFVAGFLTLVVIFVAFLLWQGLLAQSYGASIARSLPPAPKSGACVEAAPDARPAPTLWMLRSCRIEMTPGGTARLLLTMTDGRTYQANVTSR